MKNKTALAVCGVLAVTAALSAAGTLGGSVADAAAVNKTEEAQDAAAEGLTAPEASEEAGDGTTQETAKEASTEAGTSEAEEEETGENLTAGTDYYSLTIPESWKGRYEVREEDAVDGIPVLGFYADNAGENRPLFHLGMYSQRDHYLSLDDYSYLGDLTADDGTVYAVIASFDDAGDLTAAGEDAAVSMAADIPGILESLKAAEGMTYRKGRSRISVTAEHDYRLAVLFDAFQKKGELPNGTVIGISAGEKGVNQYALADVDGDGQEELLFKIGGKAVAVGGKSAAAEPKTEEEEGAAPEEETGEKAEESAEEAPAYEAVEGLSEEQQNALNEQIAAIESAARDAVEQARQEAQEAAAAEAAEEEPAPEQPAVTDPNAYYIFCGTDADSHAKHLDASQFEEAYKAPDEIEWQEITPSAAAKLYRKAYTPVGGTNAGEDAKIRHAYKEILTGILTDNALPDGNAATSLHDFTAEDMEENEFSIADVDADGVDELVVRLLNTSLDSRQELVYGFDGTQESAVLEFSGTPGITYYLNGSLKAEDAYDNGAPSSLWPYSLYAYDEESGNYVSKGSVYAWDRDRAEAENGRTIGETPGEAFEEFDDDGNGRIYWMDDGRSVDGADDGEYNEWVESVTENSSAADLEWKPLTEDNVQNALEK